MLPSIQETWAAMEGLVRAGLVRSLGVSNFSARKLEALMAHAAIPPAVCQVRRRGLAGWLDDGRP